jgi:hypothetical protein
MNDILSKISEIYFIKNTIFFIVIMKNKKENFSVYDEYNRSKSYNRFLENNKVSVTFINNVFRRKLINESVNIKFSINDSFEQTTLTRTPIFSFLFHSVISRNSKIIKNRSIIFNGSIYNYRDSSDIKNRKESLMNLRKSSFIY